MDIRTKTVEMGFSKVYEYLDRNPEENLPKILSIVRRAMPDKEYDSKFKMFEMAIKDKDSPWHKLLLSLWTDVDADVRKTAFRNFIVNAFFLWSQTRKANEKEYGFLTPWTILIDPTSACNLHCTGCWAAEYGNKLNLSFDDLDDIIEQGKKLGMHMFLFSGGEPLVRKNDIIALCSKHSDCEFLAFTNGTLIDDEFADDMLRVKNFIPAISVEGFENATDARRGEGAYRRVLKATSILKERKLPFGFSCCYTSQNTSCIGSEEYFDWMIDCGAKFCWFFTYMPVGKGAPTNLMVSAEQRAEMYHKIREFRKTKPLFTLDFWNDGEYVKGCIAGGRYYFHINANGDAEPCAFIHYSDSNIHEKSLVEILSSPLFADYRSKQPFNCNHLRPCPLLDNPDRLMTMVNETKSRSTDLAAPEEVGELAGKCMEKAEKWAPVADELWRQKEGCR